jgi:hypothetical protein
LGRIAERLGFKVATLDMAAPVFGSTHEMMSAQYDASSLEDDPCEVSNPSCEAPAGMLIGGMVIDGTESADYECSECGCRVCGNCSHEDSSGGRVCDNCAEDKE